MNIDNEELESSVEKGKIEVIGDYVIFIDDRNFTAMVDLHKVVTDKKGVSKNSYNTIGYYSTLESALDGIVKYITKKKLGQKGTVRKLGEALEVIKESNGLMIELLDKFAKEIDADNLTRETINKEMKKLHDESFKK